MQTQAYFQLLSGSVSSVYALEGEALEFQHSISIQAEEMSHAAMITAELRESWNRMKSTIVELRSQLASAGLSGGSEQQDLYMRIDDELRIRGELATCLARESAWKNEMHTATFDIQHFVKEILFTRYN